MTMVCLLQVKYVVELAKTLSKHPMVHRCDLLTRMIRDPEVSEDYGQEEEQIAEGQGELGGSYIRRVVAGNPKVYLPKESLWPHVRECVLSSSRSDCGIFVCVTFRTVCTLSLLQCSKQSKRLSAEGVAVATGACERCFSFILLLLLVYCCFLPTLHTLHKPFMTLNCFAHGWQLVQAVHSARARCTCCRICSTVYTCFWPPFWHRTTCY